MNTVKECEGIFLKNGDKDKAGSMKAYMRGKFEFAGLMAEERRKLQKRVFPPKDDVTADYLIKSIPYFWKSPLREMQYAGIELIVRSEHTLNSDFMETAEFMITHKSWWDTVDSIASNIVGSILVDNTKMQEYYSVKWLESSNIWLQRTAVIFQLKYKDRTNRALLFENISQCLGSDEFFINKAIGWALRQYAGTDPASVIKFVNNTELSALSRSQALKHIDIDE
ncbi:MAG: DNA alkylation repair protein [bacterium]